MRTLDNVAGRHIEVGDIIVFGLSVTDRITAIEPYDTSRFEWHQEGTRIARGATGVEMTLFPGQTYRRAS